MNKYEAAAKAYRLWSNRGITFATIRRKSVTDRFEVGYYARLRIVLGAGPTWESAFERAAGDKP